MTTAVVTELRLVSPLPDDWWPLVWDWLLQYPELNFDDEGECSSLDAFMSSRKALRAQGERTWGVSVNGQPCGFMAFMPLNGRLGVTHGIVFDRAVHGSGVARTAVKAVLLELFGAGVDKVQSFVFADNVRIHKFLRRLGAVQEGVFARHAVRGGKPVDMVAFAFFREEMVCQPAAS